MDLGTLLYIAIIVIVVIANIYKGIKKATEEQRQRQADNANRPPSQPNAQPQQPRPQTETIPDPWQQRPPAPQPRTNTSNPRPVTKTTQPAPRKKTIEEILEEMTRQYEQPQTSKRETLDSPYSTLEKPASTITPPPAAKPARTSVGTNYKFDESTASRALSADSYTNILEEDDVLEDVSTSHLSPFNPREAIKYSILLERKYQ